MPEVIVEIGGREFSVSCHEGEEHFLQSAAKMLDREASALSSQIGRLTESRMLLMAGLMLGDKTAGMEDQMRATEDRIAALEAEVEELKEKAATPETVEVEVPMIPDAVPEALAELAARAEALAVQVEEKLAD
jgi:cell division protein ZapA